MGQPEHQERNAAGAAAYEVAPTTLFDPSNRHVRVIGIGAGISGLLMAYKIQMQCENVSLNIYEKNDSIGGTWFENRYPGCDVPAHSYVYPWAPNPNWPRLLAGSADIEQYLNDVADVLNLRQYIHVNHQVAGCWWDEDKGKWKVKIQLVEKKRDWSSPEPAKVVREFWDEGDLILHATGILHRWSFPDIPGLKDFKGRVVHTAGWPDDYQKEQWEGQDVVVIGSGATSIQVVPAMQKYVKSLAIFARSRNWFIEVAGHTGNGREYDENEREAFRKDPEALIKHTKEGERLWNSSFEHAILGTDMQKEVMEAGINRMKEQIKDQRILKKLIPSYPVFCRRPLAGDAYMEAIQQSNVNLHFETAVQITEDGAYGDEGTFAKCDTIICATGFDASWKPNFPVVGRGGVSLHDKWKDTPEAYFGLACPDMPNWLMFIGPNWPITSGSVMGSLDAHGDYAVQCIKKIQNEWLHSFCPRQDATDEYNQHTQTWVKKSVWGQDCPSWYKNNKNGHVNAVYCGHMLHYRDMVSSVRWEDMDIRYSNNLNRFAFMGIGRPLAHIKKDVDIVSYFSVDRIDKRWRAAKLDGVTVQ